MIKTHLIAVLVTLSAAPFVTQNLYAQSRSVSSLRPGERVKYTIRGNQWSEVGVLSDLTDSALIIRRSLRLPLIRLGFDSVAVLAVSGGRRSARAGALHGAVVGLTIGLVVGTVFTLETVNGCVNCGNISPLGVAAIVSAAGTVVLTGVGALIGTLAPGERWIRVSLVKRLE